MTIIPIKKCIPWLRWDENIALEIVFSAALAEDRTIVKETQVAFKKITTPLLTTLQYKVEISSYTGNGSETTLMAGCTHNQSPSDYSMTDSKDRWSHYMHICLINRPIAEITFWLCKKIIICWFLGNKHMSLSLRVSFHITGLSPATVWNGLSWHFRKAEGLFGCRWKQLMQRGCQ